MKKKIIVAVIIFLIVLASLYLGCSVYFHATIKNSYASKLGYNEQLHEYLLTKNDITYHVSVPKWWSLGKAGINVSSKQVYDTTGNMINEGFRASVSIKPFTKEKQIRILLDYWKEGGKIGTAAIVVDEKGNLLNAEKYSELTRQIYEKKTDVIQEIIGYYREMWGMFK